MIGSTAWRKAEALASKATAANAIGLGGMLFLVLRLLAVAHYDWQVAFSLADSINFDDVIGVVVGTFLGAGTFTGVLLALLLPLAVARHVRHLKSGDWKPHQTMFMAVLAAVFAAGVITLRAWPALLVVLVASTAVFTVMWRHGPLRRYLDKVNAHLGVAAWLAFLAIGGLDDTVWVPEEHIGLRDGSTVTGYVMNVESPYTKVLTAHGRDIRVLLAGEIASRAD